MELPSVDLLGILYKLLPGLLAATIFHSLTPYPRREVFDRIVSALLFTLLAELGVAAVKPAVFFFGNHILSLGLWTDRGELACAALIAAGASVVLSVAVNNDWTHRHLRWLRVTKRTSLSMQWFSAFAEYERYVVLNLHDERRILGWPCQWPDEADRGHFLLQQAVWLLNDGSRAPMLETEALLIPAVDVKYVEFLRFANDPVMAESRDTTTEVRAKLIGLQEESTNGKQDRPRDHAKRGKPNGPGSEPN